MNYVNGNILKSENSLFLFFVRHYTNYHVNKDETDSTFGSNRWERWRKEISWKAWMSWDINVNIGLW